METLQEKIRRIKLPYTLLDEIDNSFKQEYSYRISKQGIIVLERVAINDEEFNATPLFSLLDERLSIQGVYSLYLFENDYSFLGTTITYITEGKIHSKLTGTYISVKDFYKRISEIERIVLEEKNIRLKLKLNTVLKA